jgi:hypothetical protein
MSSQTVRFYVPLYRRTEQEKDTYHLRDVSELIGQVLLILSTGEIR